MSTYWRCVNLSHLEYPTMCLSEVTLTFFGHSHSKALLKAAVLTAVPRHLIDDAVLVTVTRVHHVLLDASTEETLLSQTHRHRAVIKERKILNLFCFYPH